MDGWIDQKKMRLLVCNRRGATTQDCSNSYYLALSGIRLSLSLPHTWDHCDGWGIHLHADTELIIWILFRSSWGRMMIHVRQSLYFCDMIIHDTFIISKPDPLPMPPTLKGDQFPDWSKPRMKQPAFIIPNRWPSGSLPISDFFWLIHFVSDTSRLLPDAFAINWFHRLN